jgi:cell division protein DivIC
MAEKLSDLEYYVQKLPAPVRNKYLLVGGLFLLWMLFFDRNSVIAQIRLNRTKRELYNKMEYYGKEAKQAEWQQNAIFSSDPSLEQFAREKYYMKRSNEEVIVVEEQ